MDASEKSKYFIGVEAVCWSHSTAVMADAEGNILSAFRLPNGISLNMTPRNELRCRILDLLSGVVERAGLQREVFEETSVCVGLTGVTFDYDAQVDLPQQIERHQLKCRRLICTGDAEIIFAALARQNTGTAIICHMGSTAYVIQGNKRHRFGGWGPMIGDEGSGYAMGRDTLRAIGHEYDRQQKSSVLWDEVRKWLEAPELPKQTALSGLPPHPPLADWMDASYHWRKQVDKLPPEERDNDRLRAAIFTFSHATVRDDGVWAWRNIASSLTIPLFRAYHLGDAQAREIVEGAAARLVDQHAEACEVWKVTPACGPLVLYGGVISRNPGFAELIEEKLRKHWPHEHCNFPNIITAQSVAALRPACGALFFALGGSTTLSLRLPPEAMIEKIIAQVATSNSWSELKND